MRLNMEEGDGRAREGCKSRQKCRSADWLLHPLGSFCSGQCGIVRRELAHDTWDLVAARPFLGSGIGIVAHDLAVFGSMPEFRHEVAAAKDQRAERSNVGEYGRVALAFGRPTRRGGEFSGATQIP
jgi:hypothetical protein